MFVCRVGVCAFVHQFVSIRLLLLVVVSCCSRSLMSLTLCWFSLSVCSTFVAYSVAHSLMRFVHFGAPVTRLIVSLLSCRACYFVPFIKRSAPIASFWFRVEFSSSSMFCRSRCFVDLSSSSRILAMLVDASRC